MYDSVDGTVPINSVDDHVDDVIIYVYHHFYDDAELLHTSIYDLNSIYISVLCIHFEILSYCFII